MDPGLACRNFTTLPGSSRSVIPMPDRIDISSSFCTVPRPENNETTTRRPETPTNSWQHRCSWESRGIQLLENCSDVCMVCLDIGQLKNCSKRCIYVQYWQYVKRDLEICLQECITSAAKRSKSWNCINYCVCGFPPVWLASRLSISRLMTPLSNGVVAGESETRGKVYWKWTANLRHV